MLLTFTYFDNFSKKSFNFREPIISLKKLLENKTQIKIRYTKFSVNPMVISSFFIYWIFNIIMRIAAIVEYLGTDYCGFQIQPNVKTIQQYLEAALSEVANHNVKIEAAGRTDAGVHALGQVFSL